MQQQPARLRHTPYGLFESRVRQTAVRCRAPETTHEVFSWTRCCERGAPETRKIAENSVFFHAREAYYYGFVTVEKTAFTKDLLVSRRIFWTIKLAYLKKLWSRKSFPWGVLSCWAQKKAKKGIKKPKLLQIYICSSETSKYGSWLRIPYHFFKPLVFVAETPTRGYSKTCTWGFQLPVKLDGLLPYWNTGIFLMIFDE